MLQRALKVNTETSEQSPEKLHQARCVHVCVSTIISLAETTQAATIFCLAMQVGVATTGTHLCDRVLIQGQTCRDSDSVTWLTW